MQKFVELLAPRKALEKKADQAKKDFQSLTSEVEKNQSRLNDRLQKLDLLKSDESGLRKQRGIILADDGDSSSIDNKIEATRKSMEKLQDEIDRIENLLTEKKEALGKLSESSKAAVEDSVKAELFEALDLYNIKAKELAAIVQVIHEKTDQLNDKFSTFAYVLNEGAISSIPLANPEGVYNGYQNMKNRDETYIFNEVLYHADKKRSLMGASI